MKKKGGAARLTIEELARRAGTTTRNVRAHQTRGLLPPPRLEGRTGYYGEEHLARLRLIADLQARGFSLAAIGEVIRTWETGGDLAAIVGFQEALAAPWTSETPERMSAGELLGMFPEAAERPDLVERALALDVLRADGDGFVVPSPRLLRMGRALTESGIPLEAALDEVARLKRETGRIARGFVKLFRSEVWERAAAEGYPAERMAEATAALERLRPVAFEAMIVMLGQAMEREVERASTEELSRIAARRGRAG